MPGIPWKSKKILKLRVVKFDNILRWTHILLGQIYIFKNHIKLYINIYFSAVYRALNMSDLAHRNVKG